uniref:Toll-like receptor 21 n=1 Tax=Strix occidentalis caurina TaxID=311401 RepID=A0A8D0FS54_STROC
MVPGTARPAMGAPRRVCLMGLPRDILTYRLQRLDLQYNRIRSLHPKLGSLGDSTFSGLPNLLYLHLESNRIRWLSRGAFTGLAKLRFLDLSGNQQSSLRHPDIFGPLRSLHTLLLASNSLQQLMGGLFQHLPSLAKLSLSGNRLAHLQNGGSYGEQQLVPPLGEVGAVNSSVAFCRWFSRAAVGNNS